MKQINHVTILCTLVCTFLFIGCNKAQDLLQYQPLDLVNSQRFDVMAKYLYAKHRELGVKSNWAQKVYGAHLKVWGNLQEFLPLPSFPHFDCAKEYTKKSGLQEFLNAFHNILDSVKNDGFDMNKSVIPIHTNRELIDGSHRLAAALVYDTPVLCKVFDETKNISIKYHRHNASAEVFKQKKVFLQGGLKEKYLDAMAFEYVNLKHNTYIVAIFPSTRGQHGKIRNILSTQGSIIYEKDIYLENNGPLNFMRLLYEEDDWIGGKILRCFPEGNGVVRIFLYETDKSLRNIKEIKNQIRALFGTEHDSIYINNTYKETLRIAQTVLVKNSIHWLNYSQLNLCKNFERYIEYYKQWLKQNNINSECFCIDGNAVLSAYRLQDCNNLSFFHHGYDDRINQLDYPCLKSHNNQLVYYTFLKDDIIFNPKHHFYYKGLKFSSLDVAQSIKIQ